MKRFCIKYGALPESMDQFCASSSAPVDPEPASKTLSQEKGFFYRLWHNHYLRVATVKINPFINYVYAVPGGGALLAAALVALASWAGHSSADAPLAGFHGICQISMFNQIAL